MDDDAIKSFFQHTKHKLWLLLIGNKKEEQVSIPIIKGAAERMTLFAIGCLLIMSGNFQLSKEVRKKRSNDTFPTRRRAKKKKKRILLRFLLPKKKDEYINALFKDLEETPKAKRITDVASFFLNKIYKMYAQHHKSLNRTVLTLKKTLNFVFF